MPIRSNIVNANIFHYFKWKITIYVIKHFVMSSVYLYSNKRWLTTNQIASFQIIVVPGVSKKVSVFDLK